MHVVAATEPTRTAVRDKIKLNDTRRRIDNLLQQVCPVAELALDEAEVLLAALGGIVRARQGDGSLTVGVAIKSPSGGPHVVASWSLSPTAEAS
jgi:hypothetical protein